VGGIDWGYRDPFLMIIRAITPYGYKVEVSEYYKCGLRPSQIVELVKQRMAMFGVSMFYADPSRPDLILELQVAGVPIIGANNSIQEGIDKHYELIKSGNYRILKGACPKLIDEYDTYHYSEEQDLLPDQNSKKSRELPVDQNNHAADAARYITIMTNSVVGDRSPKMPNESIKSHHPTDVFRAKLNRRIENDL
jgi:hypothetical protein